MLAIRNILNRLRQPRVRFPPIPPDKQASYAEYRKLWSAAVGNPLPEPGSGPAKFDQSGF